MLDLFEGYVLTITEICIHNGVKPSDVHDSVIRSDKKKMIINYNIFIH